ncbi:MAG: GyrI-like domain-containing protein [Chitinophagaceae bacterium]
MNPTSVTQHLPAFHLIGVTIRTTNQQGQSQKDISLLWEQFFSQNLLEKIPRKYSPDIYCLYTDYASDANGPYSTVLGCRVLDLAQIPVGMVGKTIPGSDYRCYSSVGKMPDALLATWMKIYQTVRDRKFLADFDIYGKPSQDPSQAMVNTYLSVW